jgi:5-methylthioadenosine/S-adenosylhomocysteine deaminase
MGPGGDLEDGAVAFAGGEVLAQGPFAEVAGRYPEARVVGDGHGVVLPGLVNATRTCPRRCCAAWART